MIQPPRGAPQLGDSRRGDLVALIGGQLSGGCGEDGNWEVEVCWPVGVDDFGQEGLRRWVERDDRQVEVQDDDPGTFGGQGVRCGGVERDAAAQALGEVGGHPPHEVHLCGVEPIRGR